MKEKKCERNVEVINMFLCELNNTSIRNRDGIRDKATKHRKEIQKKYSGVRCKGYQMLSSQEKRIGKLPSIQLRVSEVHRLFNSLCVFTMGHAKYLTFQSNKILH